MDIWVRSQDKEKLSNICKIYYESWSFNEQHHTVRCETHELGEYATKERCLEIIDEIQGLLMGSQMIIFKDIDIDDLKKEDLFPFKSLAWYSSPTLNRTDSTVTVNQLNTVVYEMPQE
jgi:hypothetical protein